MSLTGKQKRYLRGLANHLSAVVMIGKDGITNTVIKSLDNALEAHELVKVSVLKSCEIEFNEITIDLVANTHSDLVQTIGKTIILYRKSKEHKIILP